MNDETWVPQVGDLVCAQGQTGLFWVAVPSLGGLQTAVLRLVGREDYHIRVPWGALTHVREEAENTSSYTMGLRARWEALQKSHQQEREAVARLKAASSETAGFPISPQIPSDAMERHEKNAAALSLVLDELKAIIEAREDKENLRIALLSVAYKSLSH